MRIVGEIPNPHCKITIFQWNNRYLIKLETGLLEQTFKIDQFEIFDEKDLQKIVNGPFLKQALNRFSDMEKSLREALEQQLN